MLSDDWIPSCCIIEEPSQSERKWVFFLSYSKWYLPVCLSCAELDLELGISIYFSSLTKYRGNPTNLFLLIIINLHAYLNEKISKWLVETNCYSSWLESSGNYNSWTKNYSQMILSINLRLSDVAISFLGFPHL